MNYLQAKLRDKNDVKIYILHLMTVLNEPLCFNDLHDAAVCDEYIGSFLFTECFWELMDTGCILQKQTDAKGELLYEISEGGRDAAAVLKSKLLPSIREHSARTAMRLLDFRRTGNSIRTEREPLPDGRQRVRCIAKNGDLELMNVSIVVHSIERAEEIRARFNDRPDQIARAIFAILSGDADYVFEV